MMIIFGASGDLTKRKLIPSLYNLEASGLLHDRFKIIGFARSQKSSEQFRAEMRDAVKKYSPSRFQEIRWNRFSERLFYTAGDYHDPVAYINLHNDIQKLQPGCPRASFLFYLALPPDITETILTTINRTELLKKCNSIGPCRIMIEKPFGMNLENAKQLNTLLASMFAEDHIYRIDHYIAKDTIRNLLVLRFANAVFEPIWNRNTIDNVQITAAESIGLEGRGGYYDHAGIVRDMVQNHVMQALAMVAMESPAVGNDQSINDQKLQVFKSLAPIKLDDVVFGQYRGYREERGVDPNSNTPTFVALKLAINNWRWFGVPFYIRSGKCLAKKTTEVIINFKPVPLCVLDNPQACGTILPNRLVIRIQPDEGISLIISTKSPERNDRLCPADLSFHYASFGMEIPEAYERVILDGLNGNPGLFWNAAGIEAAWKVVEPILQIPENGPLIYEPGTWGPEQAQTLLKRDNREWISI
jgi:glucose-6-phosphate 1-dehydrogenase